MVSVETYNKVFLNKNYNNHENDLIRYEFVLNEIKKNGYRNIINISSGRGYLIKEIINNMTNVDILSTDINKYHNIDVKFKNLNLCNKETFKQLSNMNFDVLSCLDVLEHIDYVYIDEILLFFSTLSNNICLSIANHSDIQEGVELHLIQETHYWWTEKLTKYFNVLNFNSMYDNRLYCYVLKVK